MSFFLGVCLRCLRYHETGTIEFSENTSILQRSTGKLRRRANESLIACSTQALPRLNQVVSRLSRSYFDCSRFKGKSSILKARLEEKGRSEERRVRKGEK